MLSGLWLCERAQGSRWWYSTKSAELQRRPPLERKVQRPLSLAATVRLTDAGMLRDEEPSLGRCGREASANLCFLVQLQEVRALLRHRIPDGDFAKIFALALELLHTKTRRSIGRTSGRGARSATILSMKRRLLCFAATRSSLWFSRVR